MAGGFLAHELGVEYKSVDSQIDYFTHKLLHGIIGAGMGALSDGKALAGFIGAAVGEVVGEAYATGNPEAFDANHENYDPHLRDSLQYKGEALAQVTAALAASVLGQNPNTAAHTAHNAVTENSFVVKALLKVGKEALKKGSKGTKVAKNKKPGQDLKGTPDQKPLLGKNPRVSKHRTSTDAGKNADRSTAKSIFRNQTKGEKVPTKPIKKGGEMRTSKNGSKIRFNQDGSTRVDLPNRGTKPNGETIHFKGDK